MNGNFVRFSKSTFRKHNHTDRYSDLRKLFFSGFQGRRLGYYSWYYAWRHCTHDKKKRHITGMNTAWPSAVSHSAKFIADHCSNDLNDPQILEMDSDSVTDISDSENITNNVQSPAVATQHLLWFFFQMTHGRPMGSLKITRKRCWVADAGDCYPASG